MTLKATGFPLRLKLSDNERNKPNNERNKPNNEQRNWLNGYEI
jgi:hypothetical protein